MDVRNFESAVARRTELMGIKNPTEDEKKQLLYFEGYLDGYWDRANDNIAKPKLIAIAESTSKFLDSVKDYAKEMEELIRSANEEIQSIQTDPDK